MNSKKVIHLGGAWGNGGTVIISSWKCNLSIYLDIPAISTLLCHNNFITPVVWGIRIQPTFALVRVVRGD